MELERHLAAHLRQLLAFTSHSLYFPTAHNMPKDVQWISQERTLLLPLRYEERDLGVFMARGVSAKLVQRLTHSFPAILHVCLAHLACIKHSRMDEETGLARMSRLLKRMEQQANLVRESFTDPSQEFETDVRAAYKVCMGLVVVRCPALDSLAGEFGHNFANMALASWAGALQEKVPSEALAARSGHNECTILLPLATRTQCQGLAQDILTHMEQLTLVHEHSKRTIRLHGVAGFALYPQDMDSRRLSLSMAEQSQHMLHKARLATDIAYERSTFLSREEKALPANRVLAFGKALTQGGLVRHVLSRDHVMTNLGKHVGAQEGQRFLVWGIRTDKAEYKGEVVLIDVRKNHSVAEVLHFADAAWLWEVGDSLYIAHSSEKYFAKNLPHTAKSTETQADTAQKTPLIATEHTPGLLPHSAFLQRVTKEIDTLNAFTLALVRLQPHDDTDVHSNMSPLITLCQQKNLLPHTPSAKDDNNAHSPLFGGRYGETSLIFFHTASDVKVVQNLYQDLAHEASRAACPIAIGIASYPFLAYAKADMLECCHKALDLAMLLPLPHVGMMDSLALNISADQYYSRGDIFGAVEEYKRAILADDKNAMAWNSLGVCMASLARPTEARQHFKKALSLWKKMSLSPEQYEEFTATLYNLGTVCQKLDDTRAAATYFRQCIKEDETHFYAYLRLGQLAEKAERYSQARQYYTKAAQLASPDGDTFYTKHSGVAHRHLARVALLQDKEASARELLHEALLRNPDDAEALSMLAKIYMEAGEDPQMSEMLLRKSLGLRPEQAETWQLFARCLRAQGQESAALEAQDRAANL